VRNTRSTPLGELHEFRLGWEYVATIDEVILKNESEGFNLACPNSGSLDAVLPRGEKVEKAGNERSPLHV